MSTTPTLTLYIAISLDGYIAGPKGQLEWLAKVEKAGEDYGYGDFWARMDGLIMGRNTFDEVMTMGAWPYEGKPTYVLTSADNLQAGPVTPFTGSAEALLDSLKGKHRQLWLVGGGQTLQGFLDKGLVDEVILSLIPVTLGEGIPLFLPTGRQQDWHLAGIRTFDSGLVQLHYRKVAS
ncbi:dihydrofolate reductase family protein [Gallaecimonas xiamenensis]|uniref:Dihydrofolate reductase n=1 Tax=Gallaecimonas xiamenensis 3-C-1 TaxID=745411 RepID=K2JD41_9GAMM|nr:dihydrofolate reductase family protein [Gallaecimonas xiamenensis]EKE73023.1 dihydrofolate reductase [Gallaecimonas xiamenensis 3-C-1]